MSEGETAQPSLRAILSDRAPELLAARRFARGKATAEELDAARAARAGSAAS